MRFQQIFLICIQIITLMLCMEMCTYKYIYIRYLYTTIYSIKLCIIYEHQQPVTVKLPLKLPS